MSGIEQFVIPIMNVASKVLDYFNQSNQQADKDAIRKIPHGRLQERNIRPLVDMYASLVKADSELDLYIILLANSSGQYKQILVNNQSSFFFSRINNYIDSFQRKFDDLKKTNVPEILEAIQGHSGITYNDYTKIEQSMNTYQAIGQSGAQFTAFDITNIIQTLHNFTRPYINGIGMAIGDLPHTH